MAEQEEDEHWLPGLISVWLLPPQLNPQLLYIQYVAHITAQVEFPQLLFVQLPPHVAPQLLPHELWHTLVHVL